MGLFVKIQLCGTKSQWISAKLGFSDISLSNISRVSIAILQHQCNRKSARLKIFDKCLENRVATRHTHHSENDREQGYGKRPRNAHGLAKNKEEPMEVVPPPSVMRSRHAGCPQNSLETRHANQSEKAERHRHCHHSGNGIRHRYGHCCSPSIRKHSYGHHSENDVGLMHGFQAKDRWWHGTVSVSNGNLPLCIAKWHREAIFYKGASSSSQAFLSFTWSYLSQHRTPTARQVWLHPSTAVPLASEHHDGCSCLCFALYFGWSGTETRSSGQWLWQQAFAVQEKCGQHS